MQTFLKEKKNGNFYKLHVRAYTADNDKKLNKIRLNFTIW